MALHILRCRFPRGKVLVMEILLKGICHTVSPRAQTAKDRTYSAHVLVGNNFDVLHMASGLKDLSEHVFSNAGIQATNVQCPLVWFGRRPSDKASSTVGRHHSIFSHRRSYSGRDGVCVLRDDDWRKRWGWHMSALRVAILISRRTGRGGRRRELGVRGRGSVVCHCDYVCPLTRL